MDTYRGYKIRQPFGAKTPGLTYRLGYHAGTDFVMGLDDEQPAFAPGVARYYPDRGDGYGNVGTITLDNGDVLYHAHLKPNGILVTTGTRIKEMQPVFVTGNTGYTTGPHAHIEYRIGGNKDNPVDITKKLKGDDMIVRGRAIRLLRATHRKVDEVEIKKLMSQNEDEWLDAVYKSNLYKAQAAKLAAPDKFIPYSGGQLFVSR